MGGKYLPHPTAWMAHWRTLLSDDTLLGLQLDEVIEGVDETPVPAEPSHEAFTLPPLPAEERTRIAAEADEERVKRERALYRIERVAHRELKPANTETPSERVAKHRAIGLARAAREREVKQAKVREAIARHLATTGAPRANEEE